MEPQEFHYYKKDNCKCLGIVLFILFALFLGTIGLILGSVYAFVLLESLATLIAISVILGILLILIIVYKICDCNKKHC